MTLRPAKKCIPVLAVVLFAVGSVVQAQESVIEVKVGSLQTETMRRFLKEQRLELQKSKFNRSTVVKEFREDFKNIKLEQTRTLKVTRKFKQQVFNESKTLPNEKPFPRRPASSSDPEIIYFEPKIIESRKPPEKETLLNLNERQRRADIESARRETINREQNTELGRLLTEMQSDPLKSYQVKLTQFSDKTKNLLGQLQGEESVQRTVFIDLGNTYLASHRYLNSLNPEDQLKLARYASHSGTILGSNESALWVFKMALVRKPNDGETNFFLGKILSEMGEWDLALRRARNAEQLFVINRQPDRAVQTRSFIEFLKNALL